MATHVEGMTGQGRPERFFLISAFAMTAVIVAGFSVQLAMGRSTFAAPALVHAHAIVFMGWVAINLLQNIFAAANWRSLHRSLGWMAMAWIVAMVVLGCWITADVVRGARVPFFFQPAHFLVFDPMSLFTFTGLTIAAVRLRRRTDWHQRLHFCAMAALLGPGFGRLLPMPLLIPFAFEATFVAVMIFPVIGILADARRGRVHRAYWWGAGAIVASFLLIQALTYSRVGAALYDAVAAGSPGALVDPFAYPAPPGPPSASPGSP